MKNRFKSCSLKNTFLFWLLCFVCSSSMSQIKILPGAFDQDLYLPILNGKKIGVVAHQASLIPKNNGTQHLVDFLIENKLIFTVFLLQNTDSEVPLMPEKK